MMHHQGPTRERLKALADQVAEKHGVSVDELCARRKPIKLRAARHELYYEAVATLRADNPDVYSTAEIGRQLNRHHTAISYGANRHAAVHGLPCPTQMRKGRAAA